MIGMNKIVGQMAAGGFVAFRILNTGGTPSIDQVFPKDAANDISVTDSGQGFYTVAIKSFKGPQGYANVQATAETISNFASVTSNSYSNDDLTVVVKVEDDASAAQDSTVYVQAFAF